MKPALPGAIFSITKGLDVKERVCAASTSGPDVRKTP